MKENKYKLPEDDRRRYGEINSDLIENHLSSPTTRGFTSWAVQTEEMGKFPKAVSIAQSKGVTLLMAPDLQPDLDSQGNIVPGYFDNLWIFLFTSGEQGLPEKIIRQSDVEPSRNITWAEIDHGRAEERIRFNR